MLSPFGIYFKFAYFLVKIRLFGVPQNLFFIGILLLMSVRSPYKILFSYDNSFYGLQYQWKGGRKKKKRPEIVATFVVTAIKGSACTPLVLI